MEIDFKKELKEFESISQRILERLDGTDNLLKVVENTLQKHSQLGDPLSLDPSSAGYEEVMELYLKILRAQKELSEQFRKTKLTYVEFIEKQTKLEAKKYFLEAIKGKSLDEIREMAQQGKFEPTNMVAANILADGAINDSQIGAKSLISLSGWSTEVEKDSNVEPSLTINLSGVGNNEVIDIKPINKEIEDDSKSETKDE